MAILSNEHSTITAAQRAERLGHRARVIWLTGLSGSGKSTLARELERRLFLAGSQVFVLDGDYIRQGLCRDLGFADEDRAENIRRVAEVSKLFVQAGLIAIAAFVSPFEADRERAREVIGAENFVEIFVDCPLTECERRDPKGLYAKARRGEVPQLTGVSSRYEPPRAPSLHLRTDQVTVAEAVEKILAVIS
jgi:adenylyl-sulfate kinase